MEKLVFDIEINTKLDKAIDQLEEVADATKEIAENSEEIKKVSQSTNKGIGGLAKGFKGLGLAMKTAGIGLLIGAFTTLKDIIMQNQTVVDLLNKVTTAIGIVFNQVAETVVDLGGDIFEAFSNPKQAILDLWSVIKENLVNRVEGMIDQFGALAKVIKGAFSLDWDMIKEGAGESATAFVQMATGLDEVQQTQAVEFFKETAKAVVEVTTEAIKTADALVEQRKAVELLEAGQQKLMLQYQNQAEIQRQIRDDESLTFEQRKEANDELGRILDEQLEKEQSLAQKKLDLAKLELAQNESNLELQKAVIQAETEIVDIEERITGQRSEQLTNTNALIKEQAEAINELRVAGLSEREAELEQLNQDYQHKLDLARKSGVDTVAITEEYNKQVNDANKKFRLEDIATQKALDQKAIKQRQANVNALGQTIKMASALFEEGSVAQKGFAVASAVMDTYKAVNMALSSAPPPFSYIQAGISLAMGLKNVKEIMKVDPKSPKAPSGGGGGGGASAGSGGQRQGVNMSGVHSGINQLQQGADFNLGQSLDAFGGDSPVQAYVVQQDVEEQQQVSTQIQERATL